MAKVSPALVATYARKYGIPPRLFMALVNQESGGNQGARSPVGAIGLTQLMPGTARGLGVNPYNAASNLEGGAKYLARQFHNFGRWDLALAAYNAGPGAVSKYHGVPPYSQTQNYVRSILGRAGNLSAQVPVAPARGGVQGVSAGSSPPPGHPFSTFAQSLIAAFQSGNAGGMTGALSGLQAALARRAQEAQQSQHLQASPQPQPGLSPQGPGGNPLQEMLAAQRIAKQMGLRIAENPDLPGGVHPVHVKGSYHYQDYPGSHVGRATDVTGTAAALNAYFKRLQRTRPTELFYDPEGYYVKNGRIVKGAIGGHGTHVHIAY